MKSKNTRLFNKKKNTKRIRLTQEKRADIRGLKMCGARIQKGNVALYLPDLEHTPLNSPEQIVACISKNDVLCIIFFLFFTFSNTTEIQQHV